MKKKLLGIYDVLILSTFSVAMAFTSYILYREAALKFILKGGGR